MIKGKKISVVVSVYNEEKTVGGVLEALTKGKKIDEIICVDDGSTDGTKIETDRYKDKVKVIHFAQNKGKGAAMACGVAEAVGEVIVFFDSDLINVKADHVYKIVAPLVEGKARVVLATYETGKFLNIYKEELSGERAYWRKDLLPLLANFENSRLGVETYLNSVYKNWIYVKLGYYHLEKFEKQSKPEAMVGYIKEGLEIVKTKAILKGWWNNEWKEQFEELANIQDWIGWNRAISKIKNYRLVRMLKKYSRDYVTKIQKILGVN